MIESPAKQRIDAYGLDAVCDDIIGGNSLTSIAKSLSVSVGTLLSWVEADVERSARVREARAYTARLWDERAEEGIRLAEDELSLKKAKEIAHHYRWRASKIAPREYGDKLELSGNKEAPLTVNITRLTGEG